VRDSRTHREKVNSFSIFNIREERNELLIKMSYKKCLIKELDKIFRDQDAYMKDIIQKVTCQAC